MRASRNYAIVGVGSRSWMYIQALLDQYADVADLVALCDHNRGRLEYARTTIGERWNRDIPGFTAAEFDRMIRDASVSTVIVTTGPDSTHDHYICRAMELGCDVITEKPLTTEESKLSNILRTKQRTGRTCTVTFNYRYSPPRKQVKELVREGRIGRVLNVDFSWFLDTQHGADYFRRWHRKRQNSGSLLVHKATHHFDLVNWWLADTPRTAFAIGEKAFYTPEEAQRRGLDHAGHRCLQCPDARICPFYFNTSSRDFVHRNYIENESYDGYVRDRCVFGEEIDIWDTMSVTASYDRGASLSYNLVAYAPVEGYTVTLNGSRGRLEHWAFENSYVSGDGTSPGTLQKHNTGIRLIPEFGQPRKIEVEVSGGAHGGGDPLLLADLFSPEPPDDPCDRRASHVDGAYSVLLGLGACRSIDSGAAATLSSLLDTDTWKMLTGAAE